MGFNTFQRMKGTRQSGGMGGGAFIGFDEKGLRYGESKIFSIRPTETPLDASSYIVLEISQGVFGNKKPIELKIPTTDIVKN